MSVNLLNIVFRLVARMTQNSLTASVSPAVEVSPLAEVAGKRRTRGSKRKAEDEEVSEVGDGSCRRSLRKKIKF